jgi:hypothetical protein
MFLQQRFLSSRTSELPQKESNFVRIRCLKENLSEGQETEGKDLDEQTREAGTSGSDAAAVGEGQ